MHLAGTRHLASQGNWHHVASGTISSPMQLAGGLASSPVAAPASAHRTVHLHHVGSSGQSSSVSSAQHAAAFAPQPQHSLIRPNQTRRLAPMAASRGASGGAGLAVPAQQPYSENIEDRELHVEASESYLAVCDQDRGQTCLGAGTPRDIQITMCFLISAFKSFFPVACSWNIAYHFDAQASRHDLSTGLAGKFKISCCAMHHLSSHWTLPAVRHECDCGASLARCA